MYEVIDPVLAKQTQYSPRWDLYQLVRYPDGKDSVA